MALTGLTVAEYFRDDEGKDVLLFIDNIFRFTQAGSEVSALLGRMPSAVGYQPTLQTEMGELQERITSTKKGSITSVQAIYVPADDYTDPAPATTFAHLDATTNLSRQIVELGIYPAVDPLASSSRILDPRILGEEHYDVARAVKQILQRYKDLQDIIAILGIDELSEEDKVVGGARAQDPEVPLPAVPRRRAVHAASPASTSRLKDTIRSFKLIVNGELDDVPEQAFYMVGADRGSARAGEGDAGPVDRGAAHQLVLEVVTPEGLLLRDAVDEVIAPGTEGYFGVRPGHTPIMTTLGLGEISYRKGPVAPAHLLLGLLRGAARPGQRPRGHRRARGGHRRRARRGRDAARAADRLKPSRTRRATRRLTTTTSAPLSGSRWPARTARGRGLTPGSGAASAPSDAAPARMITAAPDALPLPAARPEPRRAASSRRATAAACSASSGAS